MTRPSPLPTSTPTGEDDAQPVEESLEERFGLAGRSLREHTARGVLINAGFQVGLAAVGLAKRVGVAAFLTTDEYGLWGILVTALMTLSWLKQIGISDKYVQQTEADQEGAYQKAFTLELAYTLCFYAVVLAALPIYALVYGRWEILLPGFVLSLAFLATALQTPIWIAYRRMRFVRQRVLESIDPVLSAGVTIALAAAVGLGYWSLVIGAITGSFAAAVAAIATSEYRLAWNFDRGALREYFGFSWPLFVNGLSGIIVVQGAVITGNYTVGLAGLGAIALAQSFAVFSDRVDDIIRRTIYPAVCAVRDRTALLHEAFVKSNRLAVMWGLGFGVALALFAPDLVTYVLGERWRSAGWLMQVFGLIIGLRQVGFNWTIFMRAVGWTKPIAISGVVALANFAVVTAPLMFILGLEGFAIGMASGLLIDLALRGHYLAQLFPGFTITRHIARGIAPMVLPVAVVLALRVVETGSRSPQVVVLELVTYVALAGAATWVFERRLLKEVLGYLRRSRPAASA
jgi:O-antigen/teichoic acid export membrane protein